jgi:hypothetical protein
MPEESAPGYLAIVTCTSQAGKIQHFGTGVFIAADLLLTCRHVVWHDGAGDPRSNIRVRLDGGEDRAAIVLAEDMAADLAVLRLSEIMNGVTLASWVWPAHCSGKPLLLGFSDGSFYKEHHAIEHATERRITLIGDVTPGMSGGVVEFADKTMHPLFCCIGLIKQCTAEKTWAISQPAIARFLEANELPPLPAKGRPTVTAAQPEPDTKPYLDRLHERTAWIDLRGFRVGDGKATRLPIGRLYIALRNHQKEPVENALEANRRLVVQGDAGSGKSTFLQHLAHRWSGAGSAWFPLYVRVVDLDRFIFNHRQEPHVPAKLEDPRWLAHYLANEDHGLDLAFWLRRLERKDTVVLLDGLDEAPNEVRRKSLAALFGDAAARYKQCRFVLTTRPGAYVGEARQQEFATEEIAALEDEDVTKFVNDWSACTFPTDAGAAAKHAQNLLTQVNATGQLRQMADNPMMLTALAAIHWNKKRLPDDRGELYESILDWLAGTREQREGRVRSKKVCLERFRILALEMQTHPDGRLKQTDKETAADMLARGAGISTREAREFLAQEELDSGILVSRAGDTVEFRHLTFQEYLAARELLENPVSEDAQKRLLLRGAERYSVEWREFLRLFALCCRANKAASLYQWFLAAAESLTERARTVALIAALMEDRHDRDAPGAYGQYVEEMAGLFEGKADGQGLDALTRAMAAEVWERKAGAKGLPLPGDAAYWVRVGDFEIGRYPVTEYEYWLFLEHGEQPRYPRRPVVRVSWHAAEAYCESIGARLPTEDEWCLAAAGGGEAKREYPWGARKPDDGSANFGMSVGRVTPVGLFPGGATPGTGILDMAGNVWEWTSSDYGHKDYKVLRGGAFHDDASKLRAAFRSYYPPDVRYFSFGFRCVRDVKPKPES